MVLSLAWRARRRGRWPWRLSLTERVELVGPIAHRGPLNIEQHAVAPSDPQADRLRVDKSCHDLPGRN
jgi:hypothetical protein